MLLASLRALALGTVLFPGWTHICYIASTTTIVIIHIVFMGALALMTIFRFHACASFGDNAAQRPIPPVLCIRLPLRILLPFALVILPLPYLSLLLDLLEDELTRGECFPPMWG